MELGGDSMPRMPLDLVTTRRVLAKSTPSNYVVTLQLSAGMETYVQVQTGRSFRSAVAALLLQACLHRKHSLTWDFDAIANLFQPSGQRAVSLTERKRHVLPVFWHVLPV